MIQARGITRTKQHFRSFGIRVRKRRLQWDHPYILRPRILPSTILPRSPPKTAQPESEEKPKKKTHIRGRRQLSSRGDSQRHETLEENRLQVCSCEVDCGAIHLERQNQPTIVRKNEKGGSGALTYDPRALNR